LHNFRQLSSEFHYVEKIFFQLDARNEDKTEDNLIFSEDLAEDCQSRGEMSNRYKNLEKIISEFQKEDNINNLTKQTLFDHLNNVAMSSNNNTQSARVNAGCNNIENQLGKQHTTKLFKNLQEAEAEELDIDSAAKEVAEMLKNYRCKKVPAPLHTSGIVDRTENFDGDGDDSEEDDIENDSIACSGPVQ